jgi:hypothetical protein
MLAIRILSMFIVLKQHRRVIRRGNPGNLVGLMFIACGARVLTGSKVANIDGFC